MGGGDGGGWWVVVVGGGWPGWGGKHANRFVKLENGCRGNKQFTLIILLFSGSDHDRAGID